VTKTTRLITCAAVFVTAAMSLLVFDPNLALVSSLLGAVMIAIAISDARRLIIPDVLSLPAIPAGVLVNRAFVEPAAQPFVVIEHLGAMAVAGAFFYFVRWGYRQLRGVEGLGLGDVKLAMAAGAWTGMQGMLNVILLASLTAMAFVAIQRIVAPQTVTLSTRLAFGSFLAPAIWIVWFAGQEPARALTRLYF